ncbi:MAG: hypothetical protein LBU18_01350 [Treponema sp.]|jgi:hypothetical protein|nr:hypothetical protein [Treponema sp.]
MTVKTKITAICTLPVLFTLSLAVCSNAYDVNKINQETAAIQNDLHKYDYVFRLVDTADNRSAFYDKISGHRDSLEMLASFFAEKGAVDRTAESSVNIYDHLAQVAYIAYSSPEVHTLVEDLASDGLYVQFSYKEFLVDQCFIPENNSRTASEKFGVIKKNILVFSGSSVNLENWASEYRDIRFLETAPASRSAVDTEPSTITLSIASENAEHIQAYMASYTEVLANAADAKISENGDGSYTIVNGYLTTDIEFSTGRESRGLFSSFVKKVKSAFSSPARAFATVCTITLTAVSIASGAGLITLPAYLSVTGGANASITFVILL